MSNNEKKLQEGSEAFKLLGKLRKHASQCFKKGDFKYDAVLSSIAALEHYFKPYHTELEQLNEQKKQHELEIKAICAKEGHVGEWTEEQYFLKTIIDRQKAEIPATRWHRICTRCGEKETSEQMPEEVKKQRKREKIKKMEEEIRKMKSELNE